MLGRIGRIGLAFIALGVVHASAAETVKRGDLTEAKYRSYVETLTLYAAKLREAISKDAPEVLKDLAPPPKEPLVYGYQILPRLDENKPASSSEIPASTSYSWPLTEEFIERELAILRADQQKLSDRKPDFPGLAARYRRLVANEEVIGQQIQYAWLWQGQVANDRAPFDRANILYPLAIELRGADSDRAAALRRQIQAAQPPPAPPVFVVVDGTDASRLTLRVPVYTDIEDDGFLEKVKTSIEGRWRVSERGREYRVVLDVRRLTPRQLYGDEPPARGAHIDADAQIGKFPIDGAVLVSGAMRTHAFPGRAVVLGSEPLAGNVIAHEFGHILGLPDRYVRAYKDLGADGFEILETIPDPIDIMCAPGVGAVQPAHFHSVLEALKSRR